MNKYNYKISSEIEADTRFLLKIVFRIHRRYYLLSLDSNLTHPIHSSYYNDEVHLTPSISQSDLVGLFLFFTLQSRVKVNPTFIEQI